MAANVAPPKNTGGGGFVFENDVSAWLLACVLVGEPVFGPALGEPLRLDFQTRPDGWFLDDVLVSTASGGSHHRLALSVKSNAQFTASGAPADFVAAAWEQWFHVGSSVFVRTTDSMGIITGPTSAAARASVAGLLAKARHADPSLFPGKVATPGWASEDERGLFASFACPSALATTQTVTDVDTARLLRRLEVRHHDFGEEGSASENAALQLCERALRSGARSEAESLWNRLRRLAEELRPVAGHITRDALVDKLRGAFVLADHPYYGPDWRRLDQQSAGAASQVQNAIAGRIALRRDTSVQSIAAALKEHACVVIVGASGVGKSAVARAFLEARQAAGARTLWFDATSFEHPDYNSFEASLRLTYPLSELLSVERGGDPVLIVDGLDRLYSDNAVRIAARMLGLTRQPQPAAQWRLVLPCQVQEWARVLEAIQRAGFGRASWARVEVARLSRSELAPVRRELPALEKLFLQPRVSGLLGNLKILDLVARHTSDALDATEWVGESSVADWFWKAEVERGSSPIARGAFARRLAQRQGDLLLGSVPVDDFPVADLPPLESLATDRICVRAPGDRLTFGHDLFGDWARLRILLGHRADLATFLRDRSASPLWHRAVRLLGVHLVEQEGGIEEWRRTLAAFRGDDPGAVHDLLLEAPAFAANAAEVLEIILPDLIAGDGALLRRLLGRFLAFATIPDTEKLALAHLAKVDESFARAKYRVPYWPYWVDVLRFLYAHRHEVLAAAPGEVARVVEMWLGFVPTGGLLRREAAELAVLVGRRALGMRHAYGGRDGDDDRQRLYRCALAAAFEFPNEVAQLALTAAERLADPNQSAQTRPRRRRGGLFPGPSKPLEPWPDGPRDRVDDSFQTVVLDSPTAILELFRIRPAVAREVVLAVLIEPPDENDWESGDHRRSELDFVHRLRWHPAFFTQGPFLAFLNSNFSEGLPLVLRLIHFATSRWRHYAVRDGGGWIPPVATDEEEPAIDDDASRASAPTDLVIEGGGQYRAFAGNERVYAWSAGLGNPPEVVQASLMALEQYFYQRIEKGEDIDAEVRSVLAQTTSTAILGVLCDVGKRHPVLFEGPLRLLLASPELYSWEITKAVHGRRHMMIGAFNQGEWLTKMMRDFHNLPHRSSDLRHVATLLLLRRAVMREYFASVVAAWRSAEVSSASRARDMREQMILTLDLENYEQREDPEHGLVLVNVALEREQAARSREREAMNDHMLVSGFPMRCRKLLDEQTALSAEDSEALWQQWQRVHELAAGDGRPAAVRERFGDEFANAAAAGAAALLAQEAVWGSDSTRRDAALTALKDVLEDPPPASAFDSADSVSDWSWDCFAAEAFAMVWAREPANVEWRSAVALMVFAPHYQAVRLLFQRCSERRVGLGRDFSRLRRLALERAYVEDRVSLFRHVPREALQLDDDAFERIQRNYVAWREERVDAFVSANSPGMPSDWTECDDRTRFIELDAFRAQHGREHAMDFHVVRSAHHWGPLPERATTEEERRDWIQFWRSALTMFVEHPTHDDQEDRRYPDDDERWVLDGVALLLSQLRPDENAAGFWQPIIDLTGEAHDWPEVFLRAFHAHNLSANPTPAGYVPLVRQMVERAVVEVDGKPRWASYEQVWEGLLGIDGYGQRLWEERHTPLVAALGETFEFWCSRVRPEGRRLSYVAHWLSRAVAAPLRVRSLSWFAEVLRSPSASRWRDSDVNEVAPALAGLLNIVWSNEQERLRDDQAAFAAFRGVLAWLVDRQDEGGLELAGRIGGLS